MFKICFEIIVLNFRKYEVKICQFLAVSVIFYTFVTALSAWNNNCGTLKNLKNKNILNAILACIMESM